MSASKRGLPKRRRMRHDRHFVDELARATGEGIGRMIPVELITSNEDQPRANLGDLSDLVDSIGRHGILEPLLVRRREGGGYELISGERRFHAALQAGLEEVPCIELSVTDQKALEIALIENLQRRDLGPFEEAEGYRTLIEKYGYTHEQVARAVGRSRVTVTETLSLLRIPADLREACRHADITAKGVLLQIARAGSPDAMRRLVARLAEQDLDRAALRELRDDLAAATPDAGDGQDPSQPAAPRRTPPPRVTLRFREPEEGIQLSLSLRMTAAPDDPGSGPGADSQRPDPDRIIRVLERLIERLRSEGLDAMTRSGRRTRPPRPGTDPSHD